MPTIEEVTKKYIELRDRQAEICERHKQELAPVSDAMHAIESYLMSQLNALGVDSLKTQHGTVFKKNANSVKLIDAGAFKGHVFAPAFEAINHYLCATGHSLQPADIQAMESLLREKARWDMVDFRAGKKGIMEYLENHNILPEGVQLETVSVVNIRRS